MIRQSISLIVAITFFSSLVTPIPHAQAQSLLGLPEPGTMVSLSPPFEPALIKGLTVHKDNPFLFDFIVDTGNSRIAGNGLKTEADRLIKYFFAALTIPDKDLWVNLSPYEKDRIVPQALGQTAMGRDLLAQDYILKQLTASLIYPEKALGKNFWDKVYAQAREEFGTTNIPVNTFNKVWIVAEKAKVFEHNQTAFVVSGHLKVMLEEDYLALYKGTDSNSAVRPMLGQELVPVPKNAHSLASNIIRQIILPAIEHEVNTGKNFATLRQIFYSQILAVWFKRNLRQALLAQAYADHSTVKGVNLEDPSIKEKIYQRYLQAYKKGAYNYIKEETDPVTQEMIPRKYFSGGYGSDLEKAETFTRDPRDAAMAADTLNGDMVDISALLNTKEDKAMAADSESNPDKVFKTIMDNLNIRSGEFKNGQFNSAMDLINKNETVIYSDEFSSSNREKIVKRFIGLMSAKQNKILPILSPRKNFIVDLLSEMTIHKSHKLDTYSLSSKQMDRVLDLLRQYFSSKNMDKSFEELLLGMMEVLESKGLDAQESDVKAKEILAEMGITDADEAMTVPMSVDKVIEVLENQGNYSHIPDYIWYILRDFLDGKIDREKAIEEIKYPDENFIKDLLDYARNLKDGTEYKNGPFSLGDVIQMQQIDAAMTAVPDVTSLYLQLKKFDEQIKSQDQLSIKVLYERLYLNTFKREAGPKFLAIIQKIMSVLIKSPIPNISEMIEQLLTVKRFRLDVNEIDFDALLATLEKDGYIIDQAVYQQWVHDFKDLISKNAPNKKNKEPLSNNRSIRLIQRYISMSIKLAKLSGTIHVNPDAAMNVQDKSDFDKLVFQVMGTQGEEKLTAGELIEYLSKNPVEPSIENVIDPSVLIRIKKAAQLISVPGYNGHVLSPWQAYFLVEHPDHLRFIIALMQAMEKPSENWTYVQLDPRVAIPSAASAKQFLPKAYQSLPDSFWPNVAAYNYARQVIMPMMLNLEPGVVKQADIDQGFSYKHKEDKNLTMLRIMTHFSAILVPVESNRVKGYFAQTDSYYEILNGGLAMAYRIVLTIKKRGHDLVRLKPIRMQKNNLAKFLSIDPRARYLAVLTNTNKLMIYQLHQKGIEQKLIRIIDDISLVSFNDDGKSIMVVDNKGNQRNEELDTAMIALTARQGKCYADVTLVKIPDAETRDNSYLSIIYIWKDNHRLKSIAFSNPFEVSSIEFDPTGQYLAVKGENNRLLIYKLNPKGINHELMKFFDNVQAFSFNRDEKSINIVFSKGEEKKVSLDVVMGIDEIKKFKFEAGQRLSITYKKQDGRISGVVTNHLVRFLRKTNDSFVVADIWNGQEISLHYDGNSVGPQLIGVEDLSVQRAPSDFNSLTGIIENLGGPKDSAQITSWNRGGIDLGQLNKGLSVSTDTNRGMNFTSSKALGLLIADIRKEGIRSATPVIIGMHALSSVLPLLGLQKS